MRTEGLKGGGLLPVLREKKIVSGIILTLLLTISMLTLAFCVSLAKADGTIIIINADGSIDPPTAPIRRDGNVYTLTDNAYGVIGVNRSNTIINGAGYTVQGTGAEYSEYNGKWYDTSSAIYISSNNVRIENTNIKGSIKGIYFEMCDNIVIHGNNITNNNYGILGYGSGYGVCSRNITISGNTIENNGQGVWLYHAENTTLWGNTIINNELGVDLIGFGGSSNNILYHNNFINNKTQVSAGMGDTWDNGYPSGGNYWSDYTGVDANGDGIGDTLYSISYYAQDRYPLMNPFGGVPSGEVPSGESNWPIIAGIVGAIVVIGIVAALYMRRRKPTEFRW